MRTKLISSLIVLLAANVSFAQIVMDQIGPDPTWTDFAGNSLFASQDFEVANNAFDIVAIDNFTIPAGPALKVGTVQAVIGEFGGTGWPAGTTAFRVEFYTNIAAAAASLTGNAGPGCSATFANPSAQVTLAAWGVNFDKRLVTIDMSGTNCMLAGGTQYYLGVIPVQNFTGFGQTGIGETLMAAANPGGVNGWQANPGGGFGFAGNNTQIDRDGVPGAPIVGTNLAYRLTMVPEPAAALMLVFGGLMLRRRK